MVKDSAMDSRSETEKVMDSAREKDLDLEMVMATGFHSVKVMAKEKGLRLAMDSVKD
jgi:hypothetical protein